MKTPICDFIKNYANKNSIRLHTPGHKGKGFLGFEKFDITEIDGADELFLPTGIIDKSQKNASKIFNCPTYYSTEGSSLSIRCMLYLAKIHAIRQNKEFTIATLRNVHKSFISAVSLLNASVEFIYTDSSEGYLDCPITPSEVDNFIKNSQEKPFAIYLTSPNYLGRILDIKGISEICKKHGVMLLIDNAHGGYLSFLDQDLNPVVLGADMCATSAHKTLPVLTGGAYLQISKELNEKLNNDIGTAFALFGSTSPSYLILGSLDYANKIMNAKYKKSLLSSVKRTLNLKNYLQGKGIKVLGNEPLKITIKPKNYGYTASEIAQLLIKENIFVEFYDKDYLVMMFNGEIDSGAFNKIKGVFKNLKKKKPIKEKSNPKIKAIKVKSLQESINLDSEILDVDNCLNRICGEINYSCPPAVPIVMCGELITKEIIKEFKYYGIKKIRVLKN